MTDHTHELLRLAQAAIPELLDRLEAAEKERDALRAKVEAMEKQEPFDADSDAFRLAFEAALKAGNWPATRQGYGYRSPSTQITWRIAFSTVNRLKLYLAPGAQPAPSIPEGWVKELLTIQHAMAMNNWNWNSDASDDLKREACTAVTRLLAAAPEAKP